jgi:hypothetical protein
VAAFACMVLLGEKAGWMLLGMVEGGHAHGELSQMLVRQGVLGCGRSDASAVMTGTSTQHTSGSGMCWRQLPHTLQPCDVPLIPQLSSQVAIFHNFKPQPQTPTKTCPCFPACAAGLSRLGQQSLITRVLDFDEMLPAACQGAIGVTCSTTDPFIRW